MHVRKRLFTFLFAALAMLLCTACGKWDYSREAVKAANEAQGDTLRVEFKVNQTFTNALRAATEDNIQPADVDKAMTMDKSIEKPLTSGYRLDVYALRADVDADQAAAQLADEFVNRLAGCEDEGYISMVKADNSYFYMAVLTYKHGGSGSGSGGGAGSGDEGGSEEPEEKPTKYDVTLNINDKSLGTVDGVPNQVEEGEGFQFTVTPNKDITVEVTIDGTPQSTSPDGTYSVSNVQGPVRIEVTFTAPIVERAVTWDADTKTLTCGVTKTGTTAKDEMGSNELTEAAIQKALGIENFSLQDVAHLVIKEGSGVTTIGQSAFGYGNYAADKNSKNETLTSIDLSGVTKIGWQAFNKCINLNTVENIEDIQTLDTASFGNCKNLPAEIEMPNVTTMGNGGGCFENCTGLKEIRLPKLTNVSASAFSNCSSLETVYLPEAQTVGTSAFQNCTSLKKISLPTVKELGSQAFTDCSSLTYVDLPAIETIGELSTFSSCDNLAYIGLGSNLNKLQKGVFSSPSSLTICYGSAEEDFKKAISTGQNKIKLVKDSGSYATEYTFESVDEALEFIGLTKDKYTILPYSQFPADPADEQDAKIANPVTRWVLSW